MTSCHGSSPHVGVMSQLVPGVNKGPRGPQLPGPFVVRRAAGPGAARLPGVK